MPRGSRRGARRGASYRPAAAPDRHRQTKLNFSGGQNLRPTEQHATSSRQPIYVSSDESIVDEDVDDMDPTVHYRLNGEGSAADTGRRDREDDWEKERNNGSVAKRARTVEGAGGAQALFKSTDTLRIYGGSDKSEDGEVGDDWDRELRTGEIPPYPVRRPYHLGGMGRFGIDISVEGVVLVGSHTEPKLTEADFVPAPAPVLPQYSRISFQADEIIMCDDEDEDGDKDEGEVDEHEEEDMNKYAHGREQGQTHRIVNDDAHNPARDYVFNFGQYGGSRFDDILVANHSYLRMLGGQTTLLDRWNGELRAAFEYYCPDLIKHGNRPNPTATRSNVSASAHNDAIGQPSRPALGATDNPTRHPGDYVFDFGKHSGERFDQVPDHYLDMLQGQVLSGKMDHRVGLEEAFKWHRWGGTHAEGDNRGRNRGSGGGRGRGRTGTNDGGTNREHNRGNSMTRGRGGGGGNGTSRGRGGSWGRPRGRARGRGRGRG